MPYYAVRKGRRVGIFETWAECQEQVKKFTGAQFKKFSTQAEAQSFIDNVSVAGAEKVDSPKRDGRKRDFSSTNSEDSASSADPSVASKHRKTSDSDSKSPFVVVYTDGACIGNGTRGSRGGIGVYWGPNDERNVSEPLPPGRQTNNRAEILACARAIEQATRDDLKLLEIRTDSQFTISCITQYLPNWKKKGWVKSNGEPVLNKEELVVLDDRKKKFEDDGGVVKFTHVNGHSGEPGNEAADRLAVQGSAKAN